ncbi:MAG: helix-turn-helix domain-containing protein [Pelagibacterales bacterium]|nr:helix-turn-helix domain-containing protein [Pelagibacterales bacterium]
MDKNEKQIFNLSVNELEELISKVIGEKLHHLPLKEKKELLTRKLLTLKEITKIFQITKPTAYKWMKCEVLPIPLKIGGKLYFKRAEIEAMLTKNTGDEK